MRTSPAGSWNRAAGFSLIELAVVMAILTVVLGLTISLVESAFYGNDLKTSLRRLQGIVSSVRYEAMLDGRTYELVLETAGLGREGRSRYWTVLNDGEEPGSPPQKRSIFRDGSVRLLRVETGSLQRGDSGLARIRFNPDGLAEPARFHILAGKKRYVLVQEPFIPRLEIQDEASSDVGLPSDF